MGHGRRPGQSTSGGPGEDKPAVAADPDRDDHAARGRDHRHAAMEVAAAVTPGRIVLAGLVIALCLVAFLFRHSLRTHLHRPVVFTVGHIALGCVLMGCLFGLVVYVSHLNRVELGKEREARARSNFDTLQSQILTRTQVADIGKRLIKLATPTNAERNRRNLVALKSCVMSEECRRLLTTIVARTLRGAAI